jgi:hypothetical protein
MSDIKNEELAPNEFICKICWKKNKNLKFRITISDCDMGSWNEMGPGFVICDDCFSDIMSVVDIKAGEIIESMIESIKKYPDCKKGAYILNTIVERRLGELTKLNNKLKETIKLVKEERERDRGNSEKGGGENE